MATLDISLGEGRLEALAARYTIDSFEILGEADGSALVGINVKRLGMDA